MGKINRLKRKKIWKNY